jgi:drug/metabolite transporter (DMT)-like permease
LSSPHAASSSTVSAVSATTSSAGSRWLPVLSLMLGAASWGFLWYPFRIMQAGGLPAPIATFFAYAVMFGVGAVFLRHIWKEVPQRWRALLALAVASGITNVSYLVAVMEAEVVRIVLLFYLSPLWTVPLAHWWLGEKLTRAGYATMGLALAGAFVMLWRPDLGLPAPRNMYEWLGLVAGIAFATCNVLVRRFHETSAESKSMACGFGVALIALPVALIVKPDVAAWGPAAAPHVWLIVTVGIALLITSLSLQYGLSRVTANRAAVILLFELVVAAVAAHFLANETTRVTEWIGGAMIVGAGMIATLGDRRGHG